MDSVIHATNNKARSKTVGNHGNMPLFYMYTQEEKYKVIGDKHVEA